MDILNMISLESNSQNETPRSRAAGYQPETRFARH